jgi:Domain of unknown function (DUF4157)
MNLRSTNQTKQSPSFTPVSTGLLQRKCTSCGQHTISRGECTNCQPKSGLQRKLTIGTTNDPLELEADRVADQVLAAPANSTISATLPRIQRFTGQTNGQADMEAPASVDRVLSSPGRPLDPALQKDMGQRFGHDFSRVRVHAGEAAARSAQDVNASAYTVGQNIVFGTGQFAPGTHQGRRLVAHELTHVIQQSGTSKSIAPSRPTVQREVPKSDAEKKSPDKKEAGEVVVEGLKTVAEQAKDNNPQVKKVIIEPIEKKLEGEWNHLNTGEKAATIGLGAATLGMAGGAMLSDRGGRRQLEGLNLATPFTLIPYVPLSSFKYILPSGDSPDKRSFKFETSFKADDLINLRTKALGLPQMSIGVNLQWGYDPATERLTVLGGDASLGLVPGLSLSAGTYKDVLRQPQTVTEAERQIQVKKSIPKSDNSPSIPDVRIMLNVDLMKFKPGELWQQIGSFF